MRRLLKFFTLSLYVLALSSCIHHTIASIKIFTSERNIFYIKFLINIGNLFRDVNIITILDTGTSLLAGCVIFGILGHLAYIMDVDIREVIKSNIALAFMAYPETIAKINFIPQFFSMLFFMMLFVLGIGSNVGMTSTIMTVIRDRFPKIECWKIVIGIAIVGISIGSIYTTPGGQFLINFLDFYGASFVALILAIIELLTVSWIYGVDRLCMDIEFMLKRKTSIYFRVCWLFITPMLMIGIFIYFIATYKPVDYQGYQYHPKMHGERGNILILNIYYSSYFCCCLTAFGWCISLFCVLQLPIWAVIAILKQDGNCYKEKILNAFKVDVNWGPRDSDKCETLIFFLLLIKRNYHF